jgi:hypothetical protein
MLELRLVKHFEVFADVVTLDGCSRWRYPPGTPLTLAGPEF